MYWTCDFGKSQKPPTYLLINNTDKEPVCSPGPAGGSPRPHVQETALQRVQCRDYHREGILAPFHKNGPEAPQDPEEASKSTKN